MWTTRPSDSLIVLLVHSNVDGTISPPDALRLADRLAELLIPAKWREVTEKFVAACRLAAYHDEPLHFEYDPGAAIARMIAVALREKLLAAVGAEWKENEQTVH